MKLLKRLQAALAAFRAPEPTPQLDEPQGPPPCDPNLFHDGETIAVGHGACSEAIEALICRVRREGEGKYQIDWHYMGGRARIVAAGNIDVARAALAAHGALHLTYYVGDETCDAIDAMMRTRAQ